MTAEESKNQIITFGCRLNAFESEAIKAAAASSGEQNLTIFNSCAVTEKSERDLRAAIRKARKQNPQTKIIVTGCAAQINPQKYAKMSEVDLIIGNADKSKPESYRSHHKNSIFESEITTQLPSNSNHHQDQIFLTSQLKQSQFLSLEETNKIRVNDIMSVRKTAPQLVSYFESQTRAFVEIQNGCNHRCTFCIIPFGRGNSRSVAFGEIVATVRKMVASGHKEVVFTGVDISDYGLDLPSPLRLSQMIKRLLKLVPELPRLRLSSIDVAEIDEDFLEILANEKRFMPYLHLSVQSGDDLILKRMARRHNRQQIIDFCQRARQIRPEITFGADLIAGFPTETDEMFENSLSLISEADLIFTHIFPYSKRSGTAAAKMPQIDGKIIKERAAKLRQKGEEQLQAYLRKQIGARMQVLVEKDETGKSENFLDVKLEGKAQKSSICEVKITGITKKFLLAKI